MEELDNIYEILENYEEAEKIINTSNDYREIYNVTFEVSEAMNRLVNLKINNINKITPKRQKNSIILVDKLHDLLNTGILRLQLLEIAKTDYTTGLGPFIRGEEGDLSNKRQRNSGGRKSRKPRRSKKSSKLRKSRRLG